MAIRLNIRRRDAGEGAAPGAQTFDGPIVTIGSDAGATLHLDDRDVAAEQAIIIGGDDEPPLFINRAEGTLLNGEQLAREARRPLSDGDTISIGPYVIGFESGNGFRPGAEVAGLAPAAAGYTDATDDDGRPAPDTRETPALRADEAAPATTQPTSFAAILDSLRTEEDTFYFQVETATSGRRRVPIEGARLVLGWDATGQNVACGAEGAVAVPRAVVHKDWSGVMLQPEAAGAALVNGEPVETARRLRNGDRLTLRPAQGSAAPGPGPQLLHLLRAGLARRARLAAPRATAPAPGGGAPLSVGGHSRRGRARARAPDLAGRAADAASVLAVAPLSALLHGRRGPAYGGRDPVGRLRHLSDSRILLKAR